LILNKQWTKTGVNTCYTKAGARCFVDKELFQNPGLLIAPSG